MPVINSKIFLKSLFLTFESKLIILENKTPIFPFLSVLANCDGVLDNFFYFFCNDLYRNIKCGKSILNS